MVIRKATNFFISPAYRSKLFVTGESVTLDDRDMLPHSIKRDIFLDDYPTVDLMGISTRGRIQGGFIISTNEGGIFGRIMHDIVYPLEGVYGHGEVMESDTGLKYGFYRRVALVEHEPSGRGVPKEIMGMIDKLDYEEVKDADRDPLFYSFMEKVGRG
ncbi:MAG: hypothetical protein IH845_04595 [Nanoarchaeota archaeon]|nr:hypothetical protein [Nanoarchaeota archaeon]